MPPDNDLDIFKSINNPKSIFNLKASCNPELQGGIVPSSKDFKKDFQEAKESLDLISLPIAVSEPARFQSKIGHCSNCYRDAYIDENKKIILDCDCFKDEDYIRLNLDYQGVGSMFNPSFIFSKEEKMNIKDVVPFKILASKEVQLKMIELGIIASRYNMNEVIGFAVDEDFIITAYGNNEKNSYLDLNFSEIDSKQFFNLERKEKREGRYKILEVLDNAQFDCEDMKKGCYEIVEFLIQEIERNEDWWKKAVDRIEALEDDITHLLQRIEGLEGLNPDKIQIISKEQ